jgi:hypothetical protein
MSLISGNIGVMVAPSAPAASADTPGNRPAGTLEVNMMIILLTVIAIVIAGVPLAAVVLVTVASRREETALSIAGRAPGRMERLARKLLAFQAVGIRRPACRARARGRRRGAGPSRQDGVHRADTAARRHLVGAGRSGQRP